MTKLTIELDVVATCLVCKLADDRVAVLHDTAKGEAGPKLHSVLEMWMPGHSSDDLHCAVTAVLDAATDPTPERSTRKKGVLKKDDDAKDAIANLVDTLENKDGTPLALTDISKGLGLTRKRTAKLLSEMCKEVPLRVGPMGEDGWVPTERFKQETSGPAL